MAGFSFFTETFSGRSTAGPISIPSLKAGDLVIYWNNVAYPSGAEALNGFEQVVTNDGELQILMSNTATQTYRAAFVRFT